MSAFPIYFLRKNAKRLSKNNIESAVEPKVIHLRLIVLLILKCIYSHFVSAQPRKQCVILLNYTICSPVVDISRVCSSVPSLLQAICVGPENLQVMYPAIFEQLLLFVEFSCKPPQYGRMETKHVANAKYNQVGEEVELSEK